MMGRESVKNGYFAEGHAVGQCVRQEQDQISLNLVPSYRESDFLSVCCELFKRTFLFIQV